MPGIPELESIARVFNAHVQGQRIASAVVRIPVVVRRPPVPEFTALLTGNTPGKTTRFGKYILMALASGHVLAINLMLTSRLQLVEVARGKGRRAGSAGRRRGCRHGRAGSSRSRTAASCGSWASGWMAACTSWA